jgi:hypothetical protein
MGDNGGRSVGCECLDQNDGFVVPRGSLNQGLRSSALTTRYFKNDPVVPRTNPRCRKTSNNPAKCSTHTQRILIQYELRVSQPSDEPLGHVTLRALATRAASLPLLYDMISYLHHFGLLFHAFRATLDDRSNGHGAMELRRSHE